MVQEHDDIIELTDVVTDGSSEEDDQEIIELTEIHTEDFETAGEVQAAESPEGETGDVLEMPVGREDLEAALERVIERKFSETIETILFEVTEKVIQKEIADIKAALQKDLDDIGRS